MDSTSYFFMFALLSSSCIISIVQGTPDNEYIMKEVVLSEVTPQGILNLPPSFLARKETHLCHFWVTFLKDISENNLEHHKEFGISIVPLKLELNDGDSITILGHPHVASESNETKKETWNSAYNSRYQNLEFKTLYQDVCINFNGNWSSSQSKAQLVITLIYESNDKLSDFCPSGMEKCECSSYNSDSTGRCISKDLLCNGVRNCGAYCNDDEMDCGTNDSQKQVICLWTNFEYLLMMFMTGLLLILIPAVFLLTMMYHRRMNQQRGSPGTFDGNNNFNRSAGQCPHIIIVPPPNDTPPTYEDLPDEIKGRARDGQPQQSS